jgi:hypothetical protein
MSFGILPLFSLHKNKKNLLLCETLALPVCRLLVREYAVVRVDSLVKSSLRNKYKKKLQ